MSFGRFFFGVPPPINGWQYGTTAIVRSIIVMAHNLGLEVIAEGVETAVQAGFLRKAKCDEVQGFLCAKPLPGCDFEEFAKRHGSATPHAMISASA